MSSNYKKSAKDLAFDKERIKYNKMIKELESQLKEKSKVITEQNEHIESLIEELDNLKDWVRRLLEYTELSEGDMRKLIDKEKQSAEIIDRMSCLTNMFSNVSGIYK